MDSKYLDFVWWKFTGKTEIYQIVSKHHSNVLGEIKWFGRWRQYCFFPYKETVFNNQCMKDICKFIDDLMLQRKEQSAVNAGVNLTP